MYFSHLNILYILRRALNKSKSLIINKPFTRPRYQDLDVVNDSWMR